MAKGRKTGGRQKGSVNKTTQSVKAALAEAFDDLGGVSSLVDWGTAHPNEFYSLWGRLIPKEISGPDGGLTIPTKQVWVFGVKTIEF